MIDFDKREKDRVEEKYAQIVFWAEIENACYDHARELAASLQKYLADRYGDVKLSVQENRVTLNNGALVISTHDHRTYEVMGTSPIKDDMRKRFLTRLDERRMMDEVLEWLSSLTA